MTKKISTLSGTCPLEDKIVALLSTNDYSHKRMALQLMCGMGFKQCCRILDSETCKLSSLTMKIALVALFHIPKRCRNMTFDELQREKTRFIPKQCPRMTEREFKTFFQMGTWIMDDWGIQYDW